MACDNKGITQFYLPPPHELYLPLLPSRRASPPFDWYSLCLPTEWWPSRVDIEYSTEIGFLHWKLKPRPATHPSANRSGPVYGNFVDRDQCSTAKPNCQGARQLNVLLHYVVWVQATEDHHRAIHSAVQRSSSGKWLCVHPSIGVFPMSLTTFKADAEF